MNAKIQANIKKLIKLLASNLYSDHEVVIRELIQNAYDSIVAKYGKDNLSKGKITFQTFSNGRLSITDNGTGMNEEELTGYLSTMGSTIKDINPGDKYIGKYGIGFFSTFFISDKVIV